MGKCSVSLPKPLGAVQQKFCLSFSTFMVSVVWVTQTMGAVQQRFQLPYSTLGLSAVLVLYNAANSFYCAL